MLTSDKFLKLLVLLFPSTALIGHTPMIVVLVMLLFLGIFDCVTKTKVEIGKSMLLPVIVCFLSVFILSIPNVVLDSGRMAALDSPSRYLLGAIVLFLILRRKVDIEDIFKGMILGSIIGFVLYPIYCGYYLDAPRYGTELFGKQVNILSVAYFAMINMSVLAVASIYYQRTNNYMMITLTLFACVLSLVTGFMSGSKVVLLSLPVIFIIMMIFLSRLTLNKRIVAFTLIFVLSGVSAFNFTNSLMYERIVNDYSQLGSDTDTSTNIRVEMFKSGLYTFIDSPIFGKGFDNRVEYQKELQNQGRIDLPSSAFKDGKDSLHNEIINTAAKKGFVGLTFIFALYIVPIYVAYRQVRKEPSNNVVYYSVLVFMLTLFMIGLTEAPLMGRSTAVYYVTTVIFFMLALRREVGSSNDKNEIR